VKIHNAECGTAVIRHLSVVISSGRGGTAKTADGGRRPGIAVRDSARAKRHPPRRAVLRRLPAALPPRKRRVDRGLYNILHERDHDLILLAPEGHTDL